MFHVIYLHKELEIVLVRNAVCLRIFFIGYRVENNIVSNLRALF